MTAASESGGETVARVLLRQGVRRVFTLCGGHISPILVAARARGLAVVDVRHEATAVFAADATARLTGVPGVAAVTAGPGCTNAVTAIKNAQMAESPVVVLGGATASLLRGRGSLQDIDQMALLRPHVKWAARAARRRDLVPTLDQAFARARDGVPGPVFVECPLDVLYPEALVREWHLAKAGPGRSLRARLTRLYVERHLRSVFRPAGSDEPSPLASPDDHRLDPEPRHVDRAARWLAAAERPMLVVGSQALLDVPGAAALAEAVSGLGVPVFTSGAARGLLGRRHPRLFRHRRKEALREADLVILAGVPCDFRLDYGKHIGPRARLIAANRSRAELRRNRRPDLASPSAPERFLRALAAQTAPRSAWGTFLATLEGRERTRDAEIATEAAAPGRGGLNPLRVCLEIEDALGDDAVIVADGGDFVATASYVLRPRGPLSWLDPGPFGTLGVGAGFALAARLARPESEVLLLYGDGSVGFSLAEADTFARHGLGVLAAVGNDAGWTQIARDQVAVFGDDVGTVLRSTDYDLAATGLGARGRSVSDPAELREAVREAQAAARGGTPFYLNLRLGKTDFRKGSLSV